MSLAKRTHGKSLARIFPGQTVAFQADDAGESAGCALCKIPPGNYLLPQGRAGIHQRLSEPRTPEARESWATGEITSSLFMAGQDAGLSQNMIMELANIFGGVIDFVLDPRQGDTIHLIYEELYLDGEKYQDGDIIAASFTNQGTTFNAFRYADSNGDVNYYNEDGVSMRKAFLLAPVDFTRISSNFNLRRLHPIYKTTRPHRGTDYAAPTGTPVFAAGDGRVIKAGYSRANGNYVFIQHGDQYVTRYLHLHKRKVKQGQRVAQSQVIGTVGSTGAATGPHLHYEFLMNGVHRNPRKSTSNYPRPKPCQKAEMAAFRQATNQSSTQLASLRADNHLAMSSNRPPRRQAPTETAGGGRPLYRAHVRHQRRRHRLRPGALQRQHAAAAGNPPARHSRPTRDRIAAISHPGDNEIERLGPLDRELGQLFARRPGTAGQGRHTASTDPRHRQPRPDRSPPATLWRRQARNSFTLQLGDPNTIAETTGITTVADFRRRDIAAGGEGAPLAPAFHAAAFASRGVNRAIVNIGGIANASLLRGHAAAHGF